MTETAILKTDLGDVPVRRGKVRDIYDLGDSLLIVASDRISAFDWVLPNGIPDKGRVLTQISRFWFDLVDVPNHILTCSLDEMELPFDVSPHQQDLEGRVCLTRKAEVVPIECVVRGYLSGSGWKEYQSDGTVCALKLPSGLSESSKLPEPIFTPATKAEEGHDENISFERMVDVVGQQTAETLRQKSIEVYLRGAEYAAERGIIIADTKFEWGWFDGELILIDEVLTPDSSRFWPQSLYQPGKGQPSFDKQYVRDWLLTTGWDKNSDPPPMPEDIIVNTRAKYVEAYEQVTGSDFPWK